jgi:cobalt-zinc-cadmium efflux system membrane fusion protein
MKTQLGLIILLLVGGLFGALAVLKIHPPMTDDGHGENHTPPGLATASGDAKTIPEAGPHGGKLLRADGFEVEVTIFEDDVPPEFRLFGYRDGQPIPPAELKAALELHRLDKKDVFAFTPREDYLLGDGVVTEPHSFDVIVRAEYAGKATDWIYESYEGRATIAADFAQAAGVRIAQAGPATLQETLTLHGRITVDANRIARVGARFPGLVKSVTKAIGDQVVAGDVLAVVESNESLQTYEIKAPHSGLVTERAATVGAVTGDAPLFVLTDLSTVWVELNVFPSDSLTSRPGYPPPCKAPTARTPPTSP